MNIAKFLRTPIVKNIGKRLLLNCFEERRISLHFSAILRVIYTKLYSITDICEFSERLSQHSAIALTFSRTSNFVLSNGYLQKNDDAGSWVLRNDSPEFSCVFGISRGNKDLLVSTYLTLPIFTSHKKVFHESGLCG